MTHFLIKSVQNIQHKVINIYHIREYRFLLGMIPSPSSLDSGTSLRACHHSSSLAFVTCSMSPKCKLKPRPGRPLSLLGSQSNRALQHMSLLVTTVMQHKSNMHNHASVITVSKSMSAKHLLNYHSPQCVFFLS